ncbi:FecR family protein [Dysgonomonas capnocytophagoides]|uniref:FecR family protein n=1 Tax=Dysgonomonas capnocytophagoides TaxID=45254 RepID=A0A4Y8KVQ2_9BACT|nr:FecR family protein [Dysgonomonas capnocytophagoides]TFD93776.1 FecR family protein [Dysgonomonas capnocytophagoides]
MMKKSISKIVKKYLSGRFSPETEEKVQRWIIKDKNATDKELASLEYWDSLDVPPNTKTHSALDRVNQRIEYSQMQSIKVPLHKKLSRIAAILIPLFVVAGGYLYYNSTKDNLIEITVAYGEEKHIFLPDSSEIWINAGTTIKYPKEFKGEQRTVELEGEAYFSVKKDVSKPFIVETNNLSVKVLGTRFNVKAYTTDDKVITTLTSGKVEVNADNNSYILKPNEQLTFNTKTSTTIVDEVPSKETDAWLSGQLIFTDASFNDILQTLERKFNISITNNTKITRTKLYTVKFLKKESLDDVLNILADIVQFEYQKEGQHIIITNANAIR